jgi:hypothetical protein
MAWYKKIFLGALGGCCLVMVRMIVEGFFHSQDVSHVGVWLGAAATVLIAGIWTYAEDGEEKPGKLIRFGFAAPGVLFLLVSQGANHLSAPKKTVSPNEIPEITTDAASYLLNLIVPEAKAEKLVSKIDAPSHKSAISEKNYEEISLKSMKASVASGTRAFIGLPTERITYACIVGKSDSVEKAKKLANELNALRTPNSEVFRAIEIKETNQFFVLAGSVSDYSNASGLCNGLKAEFSRIVTGVATRESDRKLTNFVIRGG